MPVSIENTLCVSYQLFQVDNYIPSSFLIQRPTLGPKFFEYGFLRHVKSYFPNFLTVSQLTHQLIFTAIIILSRSGGKNSRGHP